jgi:spore germination protein GerM
VTARNRTGLLAALLLVTATAACGVPTGGDPDPIAASDVPYGLVEAVPSPSGAPTTPVQPDQPRVYLLAEDGALVPQGRSLADGVLRARLDELLDDLAAGPTADELTDRLSTALRPEISLTVEELSDGTATIDLGGTAEAPSGQESRRAVAQIVLTATSLPGVDAVLLNRTGQRVDAPLPSGELSARPLTADDYAPLLTASAAPSS